MQRERRLARQGEAVVLWETTIDGLWVGAGGWQMLIIEVANAACTDAARYSSCP